MQSRLALPFCVPAKELSACDVIHTHSFLGIGQSAMRKARKSNTPIVGTNHWAIVEFSDYVHWLFERAFREGSIRYVNHYYNRCSFVSAPSRSVLDEEELSGLVTAHDVVSNPIDTDTFHAPTKDERTALRNAYGFQGPVVVCAGRLGAEKKVDVVLRGFKEVLDKNQETVLAIAGHGTAQGELETLSRSLGINKNVRFMGTLSKQELANLYRASDLYVIASTSETQSMSLLQAFACGLPAVGVNWRAIPEFLNEERGFLFEPGNHQELGEGLSSLLERSELRAALSKNAAQFAQQFSIANVADQWERIYKKYVA